MSLTDIIKKFLRTYHSDQIGGVSLDKLQLDAASDRLEQRSHELEEESDKLTKMIKRMKRKGGG